MKLDIDVTPIVITMEKDNVFCKIHTKIHYSVKCLQKITGIVKVGDIPHIDDEYMITIAGNIGNRNDLIINTLIRSGCKTAKFITDAEADSFINNQDIYS